MYEYAHLLVRQALRPLPEARDAHRELDYIDVEAYVREARRLRSVALGQAFAGLGRGIAGLFAGLRRAIQGHLEARVRHEQTSVLTHGLPAPHH